MVVGGAVGVLGGVGVGACGGAETTGATGATGSGGVAGTSSGSGMGGGSASTTESVGATGSTGTGMGVAGYDCSAPVGSVPPLKLTLVASAMDGVARPVLVKGAPGDNSRVYVLGQKGQIWIIKDGAVLPTPFLDISAIVHQPSAGDERGLLGLAFHPKYAENGRFFVYYTDKLVTPGDQHLVEYQRSAGDPDVAETKEVQTLFVQPDGEANHKARRMGFCTLGWGMAGEVGTSTPAMGARPGTGRAWRRGGGRSCGSMWTRRPSRMGSRPATCLERG